MDKEEKLYRLEKAYNDLVGYTTLSDKDRIERVIEEMLRVVTIMVEEANI